MKTLRLLALLALLLPGVASRAQAPHSGQVTVSADLDRQAIQEIMREAQKALSAAKLDRLRNVSILPPTAFTNEVAGMKRDFYLESHLKNAMTAAGLQTVTVVDETIWNKIAAAMETQERKGSARVGILDPSALMRWGKELLARQLMTYEVYREATDDMLYVEVILHLYDLETNVHVWGDVFSERVYTKYPLKPESPMDDAVRFMVRKAFHSLESDLAARLPGTLLASPGKPAATVAVVPLREDVNEYATQLAHSILSSLGLRPKHMPVGTETQARRYLMDNPDFAQAYLTGGIAKLGEPRLVYESFTNKSYEVVADIQVRLATAKEDDVLWSKTLSIRDTYSIPEPQVDWKLWLWRFVRRYPGQIAAGAGVLLALLLLRALIRGAQRRPPR